MTWTPAASRQVFFVLVGLAASLTSPGFAEEVTVRFILDEQFDSSYAARINLENTGAVDVAGWEFEYEGGPAIEALWNATWGSLGGWTTLHDLGWNAQIPPGEIRSIVFCGQGVPEENIAHAIFNGQPVVVQYDVLGSNGADINGDGVVGVDDLLAVLDAWGEDDSNADVAPDEGDGVVGIDDLLYIIDQWGPVDPGDGEPTNPVGGPGVQLPDEYEENRIFGMINFSRNWIFDSNGTTEPDDSGELFNSFSKIVSTEAGGPRIIQRHVKWGDEGPWWWSLDSHCGTQHVDDERHLHAGEDLARRLTDEADIVGQSLIYYYRHSTEEFFSGSIDDGAWTRPVGYPAGVDWVCLDHQDNPIEESRGVALCVNSAYREVVAARVRELAAKGGIGIHFDNSHNPLAGCWCRNCRTRWTAVHGPGVEYPPTDDVSHPNHGLLLDFYADSVREYFDYLTAEARTVNEKFCLAVKGATLAKMEIRGLRTGNAAQADLIAIEFKMGVNRKPFQNDPTLYKPSWTVQHSLAWRLVRDAAWGRPPKINVDDLQLDEQPPATGTEIFAMTAAIASHGASAMMVYPADGVAGSGGHLVDVDRFVDAQGLGHALVDFLGHTRPVRWAAVLVPETSLVARGWNQDQQDPPWAIHHEVLAPLYGTLEVFLEEGLPLNVVTEEQLVHPDGGDYLDDHAVVVVPVPEQELDPAVKTALDELEQAGVTIIFLDGTASTGDRWDSVDEGERDVARETLRVPLREVLAASVIDSRPIVLARPEGSAAVEVIANLLQRPGDDIIRVALTRRWDWAIPFRSPSDEEETDGPLATPTASGYRLDLGEEPNDCFLVDLATGEQSTEPLELTQLEGRWWVQVPEFKYFAAVVVHPDP